jgi:hypothetical protein
MVGELRASHVIHLHRLLREVATHFEKRGMSGDRLSEYRDVGVVATDFKSTKVEHEEALMALSAAVSDWVREETGGGNNDSGSEEDPEGVPVEA